MKLLAIIFIAVISVSSAVSSVVPSVATATHTCPEGYELDGVNCRQLIDRVPGCPDGAVGSNIGDRCVVDNKYCSLGYLNIHATVQDRAKRECDTGYTFSTFANRCFKRVDYGIPKRFCARRSPAFYDDEDVVLRDGKCIILRDQQEVCPKDPTVLAKPDCLTRRSEKSLFCPCPTYFEVDPFKGEYCNFIEGNPERTCSKSSTKDLVTDRCRFDKPDDFEFLDIYQKFGCEKGEEMYGRCEGVVVNPANVLCPLESDSSQNSNVGGLQQLTCFEGTVKETVKGTGGTVVTEKRCLVTKNVQPELLCPTGSSPSSINPTKCKSDVTSLADVVTTSTSTATTETTAADVVVDESSEKNEDVLEGDQSAKAAKDVSTDDAGKANDVSVQNKSQVGENKSQVEEGKSLEDDKSGETGARVETGNVSPVSESLKEEDKPAEKNEDVLEGDVPTTTTAAS